MIKSNINEEINHFLTEILKVTGVDVNEISLDKAQVLNIPDEKLAKIENISDISPGSRLHLDMEIKHKNFIKTLTSKLSIGSNGEINVENFSIETTEINAEDVEDGKLSIKAIRLLKECETEVRIIVISALRVVFEIIRRGGL